MSHSSVNQNSSVGILGYVLGELLKQSLPFSLFLLFLNEHYILSFVFANSLFCPLVRVPGEGKGSVARRSAGCDTEAAGRAPAGAG